MDEDTLRYARKRGWTFDTVYSNGRYEDLKTILLEIGGEVVPTVYCWEKFCPKILSPSEARLFLSKKIEGKLEGKFRGYALWKDGCWRYAEWSIKNNELVDKNPAEEKLCWYGGSVE
jgi:hypothetical protein